MVEPADGPGALLRHFAGGIGGTGFPGSPTWSRDTGLAHYWSHDYVERIIEDPDESHVWLVTKEGGYIEFDDPELDGVYQVLAPSDEYRQLTKSPVGWELHDLAGGVQAFEERAGLPGVGLWVSSVDRNANETLAQYDPTTLRLAAVTFPDGTSEEFLYGYTDSSPPGANTSGMLWKIVERGIDGSVKATWLYSWARGQENNLDGEGLMQVDRPDGTKLQFFYNDSRHPGYLTRMELDGTGAAPNRVLGGWAYDDQGRVTDTWKGDTVPGPSGEDLPGPNAIEHYRLDFDTPSAGFTQVTLHNSDPVPEPDADTSTVVLYEVDTDPASSKPRVLSISGTDCPICGFAPNSSFEYGDLVNPMRPTAVTDGEGHRTDFTYDGNGQVLTQHEAAGEPEARLTSYTYATAPFESLVTSITQPSVPGGTNRVTTMTYDPLTGDLEERHESGFESGIDQTLECATGPNTFDCLTLFDHNAAGQPSLIDAPGFGMDDEVIFQYPADPDPRHGFFPSSRTDFVGVTEFSYDAHNRRTRVQDYNDVDTDTCYDSVNRVTRVVQRAAPGTGICSAAQASDLETKYEYNEFGDLLRTILPQGNRIEYGYDGVGRLTSIERRESNGTLIERTEYTLDRFGNRVLEVLQRGDLSITSQTRFEYPAGCKLDKVTRGFNGPSPSTTDYGYDCNGNLAQAQDPGLAKATHYGYDALDRLVTVTQPWGPTEAQCDPTNPADPECSTTRYSYDKQDHLIAVEDAEGNVTTYQYSDRDLLTRQDWLDGSSVEAVTTYRYNDHGELVSDTDARNVTVNRVVDAADRVRELDYNIPALDVTDTYGTTLPDIGRLLGITRNGQTIAYDYDVFGRVIQDGDLTYTRDENGNILTITYPGGVVATYGYDGADRQKSLSVSTAGPTDPQLVSAATYLPSGPLEVITLGNGLTERHELDARYFPDKVRLLQGANPLLDWDYSTDPVGNPTVIDDLLPSAQDRSFDYQPYQYFLDSGAGPWIETPGTACQPSQSGEPFLWSYDKIGNRLSELRNTTEPPPFPTRGRSVQGVGSDTYKYLLNSAGRNTPILDCVIPPGGPAECIGTGIRNYTFGPAGHLTQLAGGSNIVDVTNDATGQIESFRRSIGGPSLAIAEISYDGRGFLSEATSIQTPIFADGFETGDTSCWDAVTSGALPLQPGGTCPPPPTEGPSVEALYDSNGTLHHRTSTPEPGITESDYIFYLAGRPIGELAVDDAGAETWTLLTTDHLAVPVLGSTLAGAVAWQGVYQPFGGSFGDVQSVLGFPGQWSHGAWADASSGLNSVYNLHRWYEWGTGRYTRPDPLNLGLMVNGVNVSLFDVPPAVAAQVSTLRGVDFGNRDVYAYAKGAPTYWIDPLGLAACDINPAPLIGCQEAGSGCCVLSCITDLRAKLCAWKKVKGPVTVVSGVLTGGAAVLAAPPTAGVGTVCILGAAGLASGASGGYLGFDAVVPFEAFRLDFKNCMQNHCGQTCGDRPCFIDDQFRATQGEIFR